MAISYKSKILASDLEDKVVRVNIDPVTKKIQYTDLSMYTGETKDGNPIITKLVEPAGFGAISGPDSYNISNSAQNIVFTPTPIYGKEFVSWGTSHGSFNVNTLTLPANLTDPVTVIGTFKNSSTIVFIALTNPNSGLVFWSLTGNLYTDNAGQNLVSLNTKYTRTVFYYDGAGTKPTGSYLYDYGKGINDDTFRRDCAACTEGFLTSRYNDGSVTALLGKTGYCWSVTKSGDIGYRRLTLKAGGWSDDATGSSYYRCCSASF